MSEDYNVVFLISKRKYTNLSELENLSFKELLKLYEADNKFINMKLIKDFQKYLNNFLPKENYIWHIFSKIEV